MKCNLSTAISTATIVGVLGVGTNGAIGAGFALMEQSASGLGNAFAGASAVAEDASTIYFNPAGMSLLEGSQFAIAGSAINLSAEFSGTATSPATIPPSGGTGGDLGGTGFVPNLYLTLPVGERWDFGLGINAPFGLVTEYDANWVGRFQGIKSELTTININPAVSYKVSDTISIGAGLNYQQLDVELTNAVVLPTALVPAPLTTGTGRLEADDDGWGWNIGAMFQLSPATRLGVAYRSEIEYKLDGVQTVTSDIANPVSIGAAASNSGPSTMDATTPDMFSLSIAHAASDRFALLADVTRTGWSSVNQLNVVDPATGGIRTVLALDFDDSWRYSIGGNYMLNEKWMLKAGLAFDETPVKNASTRTVRLPDNDRTWISFGGQVKVGQSSRLDFGYSHIFIKDADINHTAAQQPPLDVASATTVTGTYTGSVDVVSVQYSVQF